MSGPATFEDGKEDKIEERVTEITQTRLSGDVISESTSGVANNILHPEPALPRVYGSPPKPISLNRRW